jgi:toxin ParE1/3/4
MVTSYELSAAADKDIEDIYDYAAQEYGEDQAEAYTLELEVFMDELVRSPEMGRRRDGIRIGLRSFPEGHHIIFYRILTDRIRVVRILHSRRDLRRVFGR